MSDSHLRRHYIEQAPRAPEGTFSLDELIPGSGPIELDIGFGRGRSLFERAERAPASRIVGIEVKSKWACKVHEQLHRQGVSNVQVLCGDARQILRRAEPAGSVDKVALHFPDPWWKKRHQKRNVIGEALLTDLRRLFRAGGKLFIQTDVQDRAERYVHHLRAAGGFTLEGAEGFVECNPFAARSNRELRAITDGVPIWRILATRNRA